MKLRLVRTTVEQEISGTRRLAAARLSKIPYRDATQWAQVTLSGLHRAWEDFERQPDEMAVAEIRKGLESLHGALDALESRVR